MSESEFVPSFLSVEVVGSLFEKAMSRMEFLHLQALINQRADTHFVVDDGWQLEKGTAAMADMVVFRDEMLQKMKGS